MARVTWVPGGSFLGRSRSSYKRMADDGVPSTAVMMSPLRTATCSAVQRLQEESVVIIVESGDEALENASYDVVGKCRCAAGPSAIELQNGEGRLDRHLDEFECAAAFPGFWCLAPPRVITFSSPSRLALRWFPAYFGRC